MACNKTENTTETTITEQTPEMTLSDSSEEEDKKAIENVVKGLYHFQENKQDWKGSKEIIKDSLIVGYDMADQELYLKQLQESGFFAEEFITNMDRIIKKQDELLRTGKVEWHVNDMAPFNADADKWCNCQDVPTDDDPFGQIKITFTKLDKNKADIFWKWNVTNNTHPSWGEFIYPMRMIKENNKWKIAWMEGWDYDKNTTPEY
ncbi:MAG: hypothetical protein DI539_02335 [Flavobacterium psychrophilum]|nr:MAG: hypothetical protein DI539_02335 [Flavobacterium psychrophilum]